MRIKIPRNIGLREYKPLGIILESKGYWEHSSMHRKGDKKPPGVMGICSPWNLGLWEEGNLELENYKIIVS